LFDCTDLQSGKIAQELDYVNHHVRTKLDEIKRREVERLRELANQAYELSNDIDRKHLKVSQHLDHDNEHTFEIEDLRKLIQKTSDDLAEADRKRRGEFKEYEMQKEFEREAQKKEMDEESRKKFEAEVKEKEQKHKETLKVFNFFYRMMKVKRARRVEIVTWYPRGQYCWLMCCPLCL